MRNTGRLVGVSWLWKGEDHDKAYLVAREEVSTLSIILKLFVVSIFAARPACRPGLSIAISYVGTKAKGCYSTFTSCT